MCTGDEHGDKKIMFYVDLCLIDLNVISVLTLSLFHLKHYCIGAISLVFFLEVFEF